MTAAAVMRFWIKNSMTISGRSQPIISSTMKTRRKTRADRLYVGVDVGGSKIAALVASANHRALGCAQTPTDVSSPERTLDGIVATVEQALAQAQAGLADVAAIGLGIPGRVQPETGLVESAVNLHWQQLPAGALLAER